MPRVSPSLLQDAKDDSDSIFAVLMTLVVSFLTVTLNPAMVNWLLRAWSTWQDSGAWGNTCGHCAWEGSGRAPSIPGGLQAMLAARPEQRFAGRWGGRWVISASGSSLGQPGH